MTGGAWLTGDWGAVWLALREVAVGVWLGVVVLVGSRRGWWM